MSDWPPGAFETTKGFLMLAVTVAVLSVVAPTLYALVSWRAAEEIARELGLGRRKS